MYIYIYIIPTHIISRIIDRYYIYISYMIIAHIIAEQILHSKFNGISGGLQAGLVFGKFGHMDTVAVRTRTPREPRDRGGTPGTPGTGPWRDDQGTKGPRAMGYVDMQQTSTNILNHT